MDKRVQLQAILEVILGTSNVYFQPPASLVMAYPCIVYQRDNAITDFANNIPYRYKKRYQVTVIDKNPDSDIPDRVAGLPMCTFYRFFVADNLNHDVFVLYF